MTMNMRSWSYSSDNMLKSELCFWWEGLPSSCLGMRVDVLTAVSVEIRGL
jgi:hypothetical protein